MLSEKETMWLGRFEAACHSGDLDPALHPVPPRIQGVLNAIAYPVVAAPSLADFRLMAREMKKGLDEAGRENWQNDDDDEGAEK